MDRVRKNKAAILFFILPSALLFFGVIIVPILMSTYYSFLDWDGMNKAVFIGFDNYKELFTSNSLGFPKSMKNAILLALLSVFIQLPLSLLLALWLASGIKGERFFVTAFFIPSLLSTVVIGQLWSKIYNPEYGVLNIILDKIGLGSLATSWLGNEQTALWAVFVPILWQFVGYHMLLMYSGIKGVSPEIREAAKIDGATEWQISKNIIIPMIKPVIRTCIIFAVVGSFKTFDLIYILTNGGPAHASEVPSTLLVEMIFGRNKYGLGSAIAVCIIIICFVFSIAIKALFKTEEEKSQ